MLSVVLGLAHAMLETVVRRVASAVQEATFVVAPPVNSSTATRVIPCKWSSKLEIVSVEADMNPALDPVGAARKAFLDQRLEMCRMVCLQLAQCDVHNQIAYRFIAGSVITTCTTPGVIALTFDDGPLDYTNDLLDLLDERNVKATFFVAGNNRGKGHIDDSSNPWPAVMRRMYSADHHIASHTWTHRNLNEVNSTIRRSEMIYNEMAFRNLFGWIPTYMRAPYLECNTGSGCLDEMSDLGYHVVDQNVDTKDYENDSPQLIQNSKNRYSAGISSNSDSNQYIILAHDVHEQTVQNLTAYMIDTAQDRGYRLVTVGECLGDPRENWYRPASRGRDVTSTSESATPTRTTPPTVSVPTSTASPTGGLTISPNQRCGGNTGYTCQGSSFGSCCSWYGYWYVFSVDVQIRSEHDTSLSSHSN